MEAAVQTKSDRLEVRLSLRDKFLLKEAAAISSKNVSEFLLDAGLRAATQVLTDRRLFLLDENQWAEFQNALERPAQEKPALRDLFRRHVASAAHADA